MSVIPEARMEDGINQSDEQPDDKSEFGDNTLRQLVLHEASKNFLDRAKQLKSKLDGMKNHENFYARLVLTIAYFIILLAVMGFFVAVLFYVIGVPILMIIYAKDDNHNITCDASVGSIQIYDWLMTFGVVWLSNIGYLLIGKSCLKIKCNALC